MESGKRKKAATPWVAQCQKKGDILGVRKKWKRKASLRGFGPTTTKGRQTIINRDGKNSVVPALLIRLILWGALNH